MDNKEICNNCDYTNSCDDEQKAQTEEALCMKQYKLNYLYNEALIPVKQRKRIKLVTDADKSDTEVFTELNEIANHADTFAAEGDNLYIFSANTGNGKTSWAIRIVQSYFDKIWPTATLECKALFINVPRFLLALKDNINTGNDEYVRQIKDNVIKADIVIWDDIGSKTATIFEAESLFSIIDLRLNMGKANIFTSNLNRDELWNTLGDRLASRIYGSSIIAEIRGIDKRGLHK